MAIKESHTRSGGFYTDRKTALKAYRWELKESLGRRAIASAIDYIFLGVFILLIGGFITIAVGRANPATLFVGLLADLALPPDPNSPTTAPTMAIPLAAIIFSSVATILIFAYFAIFESNGRRTLGKKIMSLELHRTDGTFPTFMGAFTRNLSKILCAFIGGFLLGFSGIAIFTIIVLILEYKLFSDSKFDLRQRFTETIKGTLVLMEDDGVGPGKITIPEELKKKTAPKEKKEEALPSGSDKQEEMPALPPSEEELIEEKEEFPEEEEAEEETEEETSEPTEEKVSFFKKIFGKKERPPEDDEIEEEEPGKTKQIFERLPPTKKNLDVEEIVLQFMMDFDIDEDRSRALVDMGYTEKSEFSDAIPSDLMMIKGVNPTIAKRIIKKANE